MNERIRKLVKAVERGVITEAEAVVALVTVDGMPQADAESAIQAAMES